MTTPRDCLGQISGGTVLDVATGSGNFVHFLLDGLKDYTAITGIDTSEKAATAFTEAFKEHPGVHFENVDAAQMTFPDASFDTVCISNSLHHLPDIAAVLTEMKRVLKPGGTFILSEMYRNNLAETQVTHMLMHHWWGAIDTARGIVHNETFTRQQLLAYISGQGLQQVAFHDLSDLSEDPKAPETIAYLSNVIEQYLGRLTGLPTEEDLRLRGQELRQRVETVGFHSATTLLAVFRKP